MPNTTVPPLAQPAQQEVSEEANQAQNIDNNVEISQAHQVTEPSQANAAQEENKAQTSSRILGSGARRNGMDSGQLSLAKPESMTASGLMPDSRMDPINQKTVEIYTPMLFKIIYAIFQQEAPKATLKIGLIYLAKIMDFYPEFTEKYLEILLSSPENIRSTTLEMDPINGTEEEIYVSGSNTEKYRTYGAP